MKKYIFLLTTFIYYSFQTQAQSVNYDLSMSQPNSHYFEVEMHINDVSSEYIDIKMPVWAPGSYLIREFAKSVNLVKAKTTDGQSLTVDKVNKNTWRIITKGKKNIDISYEVYAFELSVRTSFLDDSHAYVNGTSMFMYVDGHKDVKGELKIHPHESFKKISTSLDTKSENTFSYQHYDELVDCPIEIGNQEEFTFEAGGVHHRVAMYGEGNYDVERLQKDMAKIVEAETKVFKDNPNKEYLFIIHNLTVGSGGLEHKKSTTLEVNRWTYDDEHYLGFLSLVAHEYFHLWNVKRIRPKALGPFDYDNENYTDLLWVMEGFTSYYDELILRRAGYYTEDQYLRRLIGTINYVENQPGNKVQPVAHSSHDAWIKAYRHNENSVNTTISYYSKGQILAAMLDLYTIKTSEGKKSLDDFMQMLYKSFYKKSDVGFTEEEFESTLTKFMGKDMHWFFKDYVYDTKTPDYTEFFKAVGLKVYDSSLNTSPYFGVSTSMQGGKLIVNTVYAQSAAETYGISVNDEIIAINGYRVDQTDFTYYLSQMDMGDEFEVTLARDQIIKTYQVKMGKRTKIHYTYEFEQDETSQKLFDFWLRVTE